MMYDRARAHMTNGKQKTALARSQWQLQLTSHEMTKRLPHTHTIVRFFRLSEPHRTRESYNATYLPPTMTISVFLVTCENINWFSTHFRETIEWQTESDREKNRNNNKWYAAMYAWRNGGWDTAHIFAVVRFLNQPQPVCLSMSKYQSPNNHLQSVDWMESCFLIWIERLVRRHINPSRCKLMNNNNVPKI